MCSYSVQWGKQSLFSRTDDISSGPLLLRDAVDQTNFGTRCYICSYGHCRRNCTLMCCSICQNYGHNDKICQTKSKSEIRNEHGEKKRNSRAIRILFCD